jgi:hypothetical protein
LHFVPTVPSFLGRTAAFIKLVHPGCSALFNSNSPQQHTTKSGNSPISGRLSDQLIGRIIEIGLLFVFFLEKQKVTKEKSNKKTRNYHYYPNSIKK